MRFICIDGRGAALLGALLADPQAYAQVGRVLTVEHFGSLIHARIYEVISRRLNAGAPVDGLMVRFELEPTGVLEPNERPGHDVIAAILTAKGDSRDVGQHALVVYDGWVRRQLSDFQAEMDHLREEIAALRRPRAV
jgi:replicative DNA helicase